jgi:sugar phosphate permease
VLVVGTATQAAGAYVPLSLTAIAPQLRQDLGLSLTQLGVVLGAPLLGSGLSFLGVGYALDRLGVRLPMLGGAALTATGMTAAAFVEPVPALAACLFFAGAGASVASIATFGAIFNAYPIERRSWAVSIRQTGLPIAGLVAAFLSPALHALGGVRLVMLFTAAIYVVIAVTFAVVGHEGAPSTRVRFALFSLLRAPGLGGLLAVAALYVIVFQALATYTLPAVHAAGLSSVAASATFFVLQSAAIVGRLTWGRLGDRAGGTARVRALVEVGVVAAGGAALFAAALHGGTAAIVVAVALFAFGASGWNGLVMLAAGERASQELAGQTVALVTTVLVTLSALATPPLGALADALGWDAFWGCASAAALTGAFLASRLTYVRVR